MPLAKNEVDTLRALARLVAGMTDEQVQVVADAINTYFEN